MLHALRSVQQAVLRGGEARRISFRDIDVEQIGYIYEGLLGYTALAVNETYLGLGGTAGQEPEIPLSILEHLAQTHSTPTKLAAAIRSWVETDQPSAQPQSAAAIARSIAAKAEPGVASALAQAVGDDAALRDRVMPWLGLIRPDLRGRPFVVLPGWKPLLEWLGRQAIPEFIPSAARRIRATLGEEPRLQTTAELAAQSALAALEHDYQIRHGELTSSSPPRMRPPTTYVTTCCSGPAPFW